MARANNSLVANKPTFTAEITSKGYQNLINKVLGNPKKAEQFVASITTVVTTNPLLEECTTKSIVSGALLGNSLGLPPSPQLGYFYLVPYNDRKSGEKNATFQIGYRGYLQLAMRSGVYKRLNVLEVKEGELIRWDAFSEDIELKYIEDEEEREKLPTIGYYAMFEYNNGSGNEKGFTKVMYWSREKMQKHAEKYSAMYRSDLQYNKKASHWSTDFDSMAKKTMLRQLLSKWGLMSTELQTAYENDMAVVGSNGEKYYVDNNDQVAESFYTTDIEVDATPVENNNLEDLG